MKNHRWKYSDTRSMHPCVLCSLRLSKTIVNLTDNDEAKVVIYNCKEETTATEKWAAWHELCLSVKPSVNLVRHLTVKSEGGALKFTAAITKFFLIPWTYEQYFERYETQIYTVIETLMQLPQRNTNLLCFSHFISYSGNLGETPGF